MWSSAILFLDLFDVPSDSTQSAPLE